MKEVQSITKSPFHIWWFEYHTIHCNVFIALQIDECRQHLVTKSCTVWVAWWLCHGWSAHALLGLTMVGHKISCPAVDAWCHVPAWLLTSVKQDTIRSMPLTPWLQTGQWVCLVDFLQCSKDWTAQDWDQNSRFRDRDFEFESRDVPSMRLKSWELHLWWHVTFGHFNRSCYLLTYTPKNVLCWIAYIRHYCRLWDKDQNKDQDQAIQEKNSLSMDQKLIPYQYSSCCSSSSSSSSSSWGDAL